MRRLSALWAVLAGIILALSAQAQAACGDLDLDGDVDSADARVLRRHLARAQTLDALQEGRCNVIDETRSYDIIAPACSHVDAVVMARDESALPPSVGALCDEALALENPTSIENQIAGAEPAAWQQASLGSISDPFVVGFTDEISVNKGEPIRFKISVEPGPVQVRLEIFRLGWYGGRGARLVHSAPDLVASTQPACVDVATPSLSSGFDELLYPGADRSRPESCGNRNGAFFRWRNQTTESPPWRAVGGMRQWASVPRSCELLRPARRRWAS